MAAVGSFFATSALQSSLGKGISSQQTQPTMSMSWESYPDLETLTKAADFVISGKVVSEIGTKNHPNAAYTPLTDFEVIVERTIKGSLQEGDTIKVTQFGGPAPNARVEGDPIMQAGEEYVMFLVYDSTLDAYGYLGGPQGKFLLKNSKVYSMDNVDPEANFVQIKVKDKPLEDFSADISKADRSEQ